MMALMVLSDHDVKAILARLGPKETTTLLKALGEAMLSYSDGTEKQYQCSRQIVARPEGLTTLFMPATLSHGSSVKMATVPPPTTIPAGDQTKGLCGAVLVCDRLGRAAGLVNAAEVTALRTALGSMLFYQHRKRTGRIVIFGAGKQALWHLRLALVLRGRAIQAITIVNRSEQRARDLIGRLNNLDDEAGSAYGRNVIFSVLASSTLSARDYHDQLQNAVQQADVIFCTTPSTTALFPAEWLTSECGRSKHRFVSAIGSYNLEMQEVDPCLLRAITAGATDPLPGLFHPEDEYCLNGGVIIVDCWEACSRESGELVAAQIEERNILEAGQVLQLRDRKASNQQTRVESWLRDGLVVYKSVGMGIMDLAVTGALLNLAELQGFGSIIETF